MKEEKTIATTGTELMPQNESLLTYVIFIANTFPATHPRAGEETNFYDLIKGKWKLHTIRQNYSLWEKRFAKINNGEACLSIRQWTGRPYNSKPIEIFNFTHKDGIGIQKINSLDFESEHAFIDQKFKPPIKLAALADYDGLSLDDFKSWFKGYDATKPLAIIHFTKERY